MSTNKPDPMRDFLANSGFARGPSPLGEVMHRELVGLPGLSTAQLSDPAALATAAVAGAYDAAEAYLARAEAEAGARVGPLRTAAPLAVVNIHCGMC